MLEKGGGGKVISLCLVRVAYRSGSSTTRVHLGELVFGTGYIWQGLRMHRWVIFWEEALVRI